MFEFLREYRQVPKHIINVIIAEFFIQLVNATFLNIQTLYMSREGFRDDVIAGYISYRYLGVLLLAIPLGLYIRGKRIKPFFYMSAVLVPLLGLVIIYAIHEHIVWLMISSQFLWGASFTFMQIPVIPYIMRNSKIETHTSGIALSYSTWSFASILSMGLVALLNGAAPEIFTERMMLIIMSLLGFIGIYFISKIDIEEELSARSEKKIWAGGSHDWGLITKALMPTLIIAVGAGLTIPFITLFFAKVHHMSTSDIGIVIVIGAVLIAFGSVLVPRIKREIGYKIAIPFTQSTAVAALVAMATTEFYAQMPIAVVIAVIFYLLRQPLMNMAGPMTSEIAMNYVGKRNQEITSTLTSAIWSGSWYIGSKFIVKQLLELGWPYVNIFLITAALYAAGVLWYYFLILDYTKREKAGLIKVE
jgi:predicted MFS family arabinose efflux permease